MVPLQHRSVHKWLRVHSQLAHRFWKHSSFLATVVEQGMTITAVHVSVGMVCAMVWRMTWYSAVWQMMIWSSFTPSMCLPICLVNELLYYMCVWVFVCVCVCFLWGEGRRGVRIWSKHKQQVRYVIKSCEPQCKAVRHKTNAVTMEPH